jgi:hypothetical protein
MLDTKDQRSYFWTIVVLVVILITVTLWSRPAPGPNTPLVVKKHFDYNAYLAALKVDPDASQKLLKSIVNEKDIAADIEKQLDVNQKISLPEISDSQLKISGSNKDAAVSYFKVVGESMSEYNTNVSTISKDLFSQDQNAGSLDLIAQKNSALLKQLYDQSVPKDVADFHKALIGMYETYGDTILLAQSYNANSEVDPWAKIYGDYSVINSEIAATETQFKNVDDKYHIAEVVVSKPVAEDNSFIPTAHALIGGITIVIKDIPGLVKDAVEAGLANAFANFATQYLNKLIVSIENNYKIANFLYYSDALVRGQYVNDYLDKYVVDPLDRRLVTSFIPQFACSQAQDVKNVLKAKADQYLGFDPATLSPDDPDFNVKLARVGDFLSSPSGWQLYYEGVADQAQSQAEKAVNLELTSSGIKSPRDAIGTQIAASLNSIAQSETAAFISTLNLGTSNADKTISKIVSSVTYNLFNKFVFRGAVVYQEQKTCVPIPQLTPIIPAGDTTYQNPPPTPSEDDLSNPYL